MSKNNQPLSSIPKESLVKTAIANLEKNNSDKIPEVELPAFAPTNSSSTFPSKKSFRPPNGSQINPAVIKELSSKLKLIQDEEITVPTKKRKFTDEELAFINSDPTGEPLDLDAVEVKKNGDLAWIGKNGVYYDVDMNLKRKWEFVNVNSKDRWCWRAEDGLYHYMLNGDETWIGDDGFEHWYDKKDNLHHYYNRVLGLKMQFNPTYNLWTSIGADGVKHLHNEHKDEKLAPKSEKRKRKRKGKGNLNVTVTDGNGTVIEPGTDGHYHYSVRRGGRRQTKKSHSRKLKKKSRMSRKRTAFG